MVKLAVLMCYRGKVVTKATEWEGEACLLTRFICQMRRKCHITALYIFFLTEMERG